MVVAIRITDPFVHSLNMVSLFRIFIVLGAQPFFHSTELCIGYYNEFLSVGLRSIINIWNANAQKTSGMSQYLSLRFHFRSVTSIASAAASSTSDSWENGGSQGWNGENPQDLKWTLKITKITGWSFTLCKTSKHKFRFGLARLGQARPKRKFCFKVNGRFCTRCSVTL